MIGPHRDTVRRLPVFWTERLRLAEIAPIAMDGQRPKSDGSPEPSTSLLARMFEAAPGCWARQHALRTAWRMQWKFLNES